MVAPRTKALHDEFALLCMTRETEPELATWFSSGLASFLQETTSPHQWFPEAFQGFVVDLIKPQNSDDDAPK
jgi:hypothetical protein